MNVSVIRDVKINQVGKQNQAIYPPPKYGSSFI